MHRYRAMLLASMILAASGGCFSAPFARNDGPVSAEGVVVSLVGQRCDFSPDANGEGDEEGNYPNRLDLEIRVAIRNDTHETLTVQPESLRLVVPGSSAPPVGPPHALQVGPGATVNVNVHFDHQGDLACNSSLALALANTILIGGRPLTLRPVSFVPSTSES
jgi:hypothetical protein